MVFWQTLECFLTELCVDFGLASFSKIVDFREINHFPVLTVIQVIDEFILIRLLSLFAFDESISFSMIQQRSCEHLRNRPVISRSNYPTNYSTVTHVECFKGEEILETASFHKEYCSNLNSHNAQSFEIGNKILSTFF